MREMRTIGHLLRQQALERGDKPFVAYAGRELTYSAMDDLARRTAGGLALAGIRHGDRVCLALPNGIDILTSWFALACIGAIEVPINLDFKSHQVRYVVQDAGAALLITTAGFFQLHREELLKCESLGAVALVDDPAGCDTGHLKLMRFAQIQATDALKFDEASVRGSDPMAILYTSGTTGMPKGVLLCHEHEVALGENIAASLRLTQDDCFYNFFPMHHNTAQGIITCTVLRAGARMLLVDRFSKSRFWPDVHEHKCTLFYAMGAILEILNKDPQGPAMAQGHTLRAGWGIAMGAEQSDKFTRLFGVQFVTGYGSTEASMPVISEMGPLQEGLAGTVAPGFQIAIVDEADQQRPPGELGEIVVRPSRPNITFLEYWGKPKETVQAWRNLWFHSGDAGYIDAQGRLFFVDRIKDVIRHRGNNVSSVEVEGVLLEMPAIQEAAVVAAPSELGGFEQEVRAVLVLAAGQAWDPEAIIRHCADRLPYYAVPRFLDCVQELPKTSTAKVRKIELRTQGLQPATWDRVAAGYHLKALRHSKN
jgi:crotonobetaine/carnitine-CoA ligase